MICLILQLLYKIAYIWISVKIWHSFISISRDRNIRGMTYRYRSTPEILTYTPFHCSCTVPSTLIFLNLEFREVMHKILGPRSVYPFYAITSYKQTNRQTDNAIVLVFFMNNHNEGSLKDFQSRFYSKSCFAEALNLF